MAMSSAHLSAAMRTALAAQPWVNTSGDALTQFCDALAGAIVAEVLLAVITISPAHAGLQTSTTAGTPTAGPAAPVPITGALS